MFNHIDVKKMDRFLENLEGISPAVAKLLSVASDDFYSKVDAYVGLLKKWQKKINLVSNATLDDAVSRHIFDSLQMIPYLPDPSHTIYDFGSGGGFPGMVLAQLGYEDIKPVEVDQRKSIFLKEVARQTNTKIDVKTVRIETLPENSCDMVVSRACADFDQLLGWAYPVLKKGGKCVFLKGEKFEEELTKAQKKWHILLETHPSHTRNGSVIVNVQEFAPLK